MRKDIIIDTDPGVDDALALLLAVKSDYFNIKAITTVAGNTSIENTTRNARYILSLLAPVEIPIYSGARMPLVGELTTAEFVHGTYGLGGLQPTNEPKLTNDAVAQLIKTVKENPRPITVVTLGPLTNLAMALIQAPDIVDNIEEVVIMGGAIREAGNVNRAAEFNIFVDPEAADIVFRAKVKKTLVPLDACNHVELPLEHFDKIEDEHLREPVKQMVAVYLKNTVGLDAREGAKAYDPLTIYYLINPKACTVEELDVVVETKGSITRGMTVADLRIIPEVEELMRVVTHIDAPSFKRDLIHFLNN